MALQVGSVQGPANLNMDEESNVVICDVTNGAVTINLPSATACLGRLYSFKGYTESGMGTLQLITSDTETIDGVDDPLIDDVQNVKFTLISDGDNWWIMSGSLQNQP